MNDSDSNDPLLNPLFALARAQRVDTSRVEYAFETRLTARLHASKRSAWGVMAWRMVPVCALIVLGLGVWQFEIDSASNETAQVMAVENPEAADLLASFN